MIKGRNTEFVPGKSFKYLGDLTKEELRKELSHTRGCLECGRKKKKEFFQGTSVVCLKCEEELF